MSTRAEAKSPPARRWLSGLRARWFSVHFMNLAGVFAAAVIFICCNVLISRFYARYDVTSDGLYTLSPATLDTLERLQQPVEIVVFLSQNDPLTSSVRYMLDAYRAHSTKLSSRFVDPDRNPAEFVALQREYGMFEGRTENGRLASEASIVVVSGSQRWYVTTDDIVVFDEHTGQARPQLEQVLTEGIVNVLGRERVRVCFSKGHGELDISSGGPQGLGEFRRRLEQNNYDVSEVDLSLPEPSERLSGCQLVIVAGPTMALSVEAATRLRQHVERGRSLLLAVGPVVDDEGRILDPGMAPLSELAGVAFERNVVFEQDDSLRMPVGFGGEVFLSTPREHAVTKGLARDQDARFNVLLQLTQGLSASSGDAQPLLVSSATAVALKSFKPLRAASVDDFFAGASEPAQMTLAYAVERPARCVFLGSSSPLWSSTWREAALLGTRRFVENIVSWLAAQPKLVSVPEKSEHPAGLALTEESLTEVQRYVLLYMPLTAALMGVLVLYRRRRQEPLESPSARSEAGS